MSSRRRSSPRSSRARVRRVSAFGCSCPRAHTPRRHSRVGSSSGSGVSCGGRCASGTCRRFTRMRVHVDERPRIESTSTSSSARSAAASGCRAFQRARPVERRGLVGGVGDHDQRHLHARLCGARAFRAGRAARPCALLRARRRHARRFRLPLGEVRWPRRVGESLALRPAPRARGASRASPRRVRSSACGSPRLAKRAGIVSHREVRRVAARHFVPRERRRHARVGERADRVRRAGRAVLGVLVVVEEDAVALLLPPLRRGDRRRAPLDLARERERRAAHLGERPARLDADVHVHAARAARLRPAAQAQLVEERPHLERDPPNVLPGDARPGVEIDAQLVGVIEVAVRTGCGCSSMHPRLTTHARPAASSTTTSSAVRPDGNDSVRRPQPLGPLLGRALLVEDLAVGAVDEPLEHERPVRDPREGARRDGQVVAHDVELRELRVLREIRLARVGDADFAPAHGEDLGCLFRRHAADATSGPWPTRNKTSSTCSASSPSSPSSTRATRSPSARAPTRARPNRSPPKGPTSAS